MSNNTKPDFVIVGGGLAGALMATYLGRSGQKVDVYEMRHDLRGGDFTGGRSINLALSHRGIESLKRVGLAEEVLATAVPMRGRMIHSIRGGMSFQPYGTAEDHAIHSVSRGALNAVLLAAADRHPTVRLHFHHKCRNINLETGKVGLTDTRTNDASTVRADIIVSADGAFSVVRRAMQRLDRFDYSQSYLRHGFKELTVPPGPSGTFQLERNALHIWPRRSFMMIALPNVDGSFTCTLFWPFDGLNSFAAVKTEDDLLRFFRRQFPDAVPLMPTLVEDYFQNATGSLVTIRCGPWHYRGKAVLLGDACHAVVPFYGQGMNAAFEDALVLDECLTKYGPDWECAFSTYDRLRRQHVNVLADLAIANFVEMRDRTGTLSFRWRKRMEAGLHRLFPKWYIPLYTMTTFTRTPYLEAVRRAGRQDRAVLVVAAGLLLVFLLGVFGLIRQAAL